MPELHISSLVVHADPRSEDAVAAAIARMDGAEIHARQGGKLVITLETEHEGPILDTLNRIQLLDGVMAATLVYHQVERLEPGDYP